MIPGSVDDTIFGKQPPLLVIGIGNPLLSDDGVGLQLLEKIEDKIENNSVEFIDGGTQGIALLGRLENRQAIIFLDAVSLDAQPGTVHFLSKDEVLSIDSKQTTAHEGNATQILKTALLTGDLPDNIFVIGIEPEKLKTDIGLSETVANSLPKALELIETTINKLLKEITN
jgi:hydrogenase maturation protease